MSLDNIVSKAPAPGAAQQTAEVSDAGRQERAPKARVRNMKPSTIDRRLKELKKEERELLRAKVKAKRDQAVADKFALGTLLQNTIESGFVGREEAKAALLAAVPLALRAQGEALLDRLFGAAEDRAIRMLGMKPGDVTEAGHREALMGLAGQLRSLGISDRDDPIGFLVFVAAQTNERSGTKEELKNTVESVLADAAACRALAEVAKDIPAELVTAWLTQK